MNTQRFSIVVALALLVGVLAAAPVLAAPSFSAWGPAVSLESVPGTSSELNTPFLDGCPMLSRDEQRQRDHDRKSLRVHFLFLLLWRMG